MKPAWCAGLALGSNLYMGHPLEYACRDIRRQGFGAVEIASIVGNCIHVAPADMTGERAAEIRGLLDGLGLASPAFAGHADLTDEVQLADFFTKMRFAKALGCTIINTNSGPKGKMDVFRASLKKVLVLAEELELTVCLESHGDIVDTARQAAPLFAEFNHPLLRLNYDTGNTYYYAKGNIDIAEDLKYGLPYLAHVHLKDIHIEGERVFYTPLGKGDLDFGAILAVLATAGARVPCGLEIPVFVQGDFAALSAAAAPLAQPQIDEAVRASLATLQSFS